jgi:MscS family membrane protein
MITIIAFRLQLPANLEFLANIYVSFAATILAWLIIGLLVYLVFRKLVPLLCHFIPGEFDDIVMKIFSRPALWLTFVFGSLNSLDVLNLSPEILELCKQIFNSLLVLIIAYLIWKLMHDVAFYYGKEWVKKTESRIDDTILPIARLISCVVLIFGAVLIIFNIWHISIISVLVGAGILSVILGLALQDVLKNMFSGISLLADAPFAIEDLVMFGDNDKVFKVEAIGMRATQLYDLYEHAIVYMPNNEIARSTIKNMTRPTIELKNTIAVKINADSELSQVRKILEATALGLPCIAGNQPEKIKQMTKLMSELENEKGKNKYSKMIEKLKREHKVDIQCINIMQALANMSNKAKELEKGGYTNVELEELRNEYVKPLDNIVSNTIQSAEEWGKIPDPYLEDLFEEEIRQNKVICELRNKQLKEKWDKLKANISSHELGKEMHFDDEAIGLADWIQQKYKSFSKPWKDPDVTIQSLQREGIIVKLSFFIDDIRLENNERKQRVTTDLAITVDRVLKKEGIKLA